MTAAPAGGSEPIHVVMFGSYDVRMHPRVAALRDGIAAHGHLVSEINAPLGVSTADKVAAAGSVRRAVGLLANVARSWARLVRAARRQRRVRTPDVVVVGYLGHLDVHLARWLFPSSIVVLDHLVGLADTARDRRVATGPTYRLLDAVDRAALRRADLVVVDTAEQLAQLPARARERSVVVPVGATTDWFDQPRPSSPPPLRVCFVGLYTPLHGAPVIGEAIALLRDDPRIEFTMVGSGQDLDATRSAAGSGRVRWIDWVESADLPALVASHHVSLGIFGTTPKARRVVPTKVYQGVAAGTVVVTSDTGPQRRALGDAARYVPAGDPVALAAELVALVEELEGGGSVMDATVVDSFRPGHVVVPLLDAIAGRPHGDLSRGPALPLNAWLRFDLVRDELRQLPPARVLEIGPGRGAVAARLVSAGHRYTGVEMSPSARQATREQLEAMGSTPELHASLDELAPERTFELVCAFEVLEHVEEDREALREWASHVAPGGTLLISVPAWQRRFAAHDVEVGHLRRYDPDALAELLRDAGLVDVRVKVYGFPLGILLEHVRNAMARVLQSRGEIEAESANERTQRSGGWFQPPRSLNQLIRRATWPFRVLQRRFPGRGTGLVARARAPLGP